MTKEQEDELTNNALPGQGYGNLTPAELRAMREARGITAAHVARKLGVTPSYLCDLEHGRRSMSAEKAAAYLAEITR